MKARTYFLFFMMMVSTGCVETIVMDPDEENLPVVVSCILEQGQSKLTLNLQYVKGKSRDEYIPVEDAKVYIKELKGFERTVDFKHSEGSVWVTRPDPFFSILPQMSYALYIEIPGREMIMAETTVPSNRVIPEVVKKWSDKVAEIEDFYFQTGLEDGSQTAPVWIFATKGKHTDGESKKNRYSLLVTDHPYADPVNATGLRFSDLPIEGDPVPPDTHLMYTWPAFREMRRRMPDLPLYEGFIRLDHLDNNPFHLLAGPLRYKESYQDHLDFFFVSEEYDRYLRSVYIKDRQLETDLTSIFSTDMVYTNIKGGIGIFAGISRNNLKFLVN